jgi:hypothetical protein
MRGIVENLQLVHRLRATAQDGKDAKDGGDDKHDILDSPNVTQLGRQQKKAIVRQQIADNDPLCMYVSHGTIIQNCYTGITYTRSIKVLEIRCYFDQRGRNDGSFKGCEKKADPDARNGDTCQH